MYYYEITTIIVPGIIILTNKKLESNYTEILKFVSSLLHTNFIDKYITITYDYEAGIINAIKTIFHKARLVGCFFHYMQSLIRNAKKLGYEKKNLLNQILDLVNSKLSILPFKYNGNIIEIKKRN